MVYCGLVRLTMEIMYYLLVIDTVTFADGVLLVSETYHYKWCIVG